MDVKIYDESGFTNKAKNGDSDMDDIRESVSYIDELQLEYLNGGSVVTFATCLSFTNCMFTHYTSVTAI
jgi:hypothetical protein